MSWHSISSSVVSNRCGPWKSARRVGIGAGYRGRHAAGDGILWCVDHFQGSPSDHTFSYVRDVGGPSEIRKLFEANVGELLGERIRLIQSTSESAAGTFAETSLDFVYIDADHAYASVVADIGLWLPKIKPGGLLAGHDFDLPSVRTAVRESFGDVVRVLEGTTIWAVQVTS